MRPVEPATPASRLELLRSLTETSPEWCVWKNADAAANGPGDVDSLAPTRAWEALEASFGRWAREHELDPMPPCHHVPATLVLVALRGGDDEPLLIEVDVSAYRLHRGARIVAAERLGPLMLLDERGFRRLADGAEGLLLLLAASSSRRRFPADPELARARALLARDMAGAERAAVLLGVVGRAALTSARVLLDGHSPRAALICADLAACGRLVRDPRALREALAFDAVWRRRCPIYAAMRAGRRVTGDVARWRATVAATHQRLPAGR
jgi:hypothetical protein